MQNKSASDNDPAMASKNPVPNSRHLTRDDDGFAVRAGFLIHDVSRLRRAYFDSSMRPYGLTRSQWWVLGQLSRRGGEPMSQVELAKHLDLGKASLGGLIDRLEATGYIRREVRPDDRRVKLISVTPKGLKITAAMRRIGHTLNLRIFQGLSDAEVLALETALSKVKNNLQQLSPRLDTEDRKTEPPAEPARRSESKPAPARALAPTRRAAAKGGG